VYNVDLRIRKGTKGLDNGLIRQKISQKTEGNGKKLKKKWSGPKARNAVQSERKDYGAKIDQSSWITEMGKEKASQREEKKRKNQRGGKCGSGLPTFCS